MLKLTRHVFEWSADPAARWITTSAALFNHILAVAGSRRPGMVMLLLPAAARRLEDRTRRRTIRSGAASAPAWRTTPSTATRSTSTTIGRCFVNLFIPSELTWKDKGIVVRQETKFPEEEATHLTITREPADASRPEGPLSIVGTSCDGGAGERSERRHRAAAFGRLDLRHDRTRVAAPATASMCACRCRFAPRPCPTIRR